MGCSPREANPDVEISNGILLTYCEPEFKSPTYIDSLIISISSLNDSRINVTELASSQGTKFSIVVKYPTVSPGLII